MEVEATERRLGYSDAVDVLVDREDDVQFGAAAIGLRRAVLADVWALADTIDGLPRD